MSLKRLPAIFLFCSLLCNAQTPTGTITGRVVDPSSAVIQGAIINAVNVETNLRYSTTTNAAGQFTIPNVLPGTYKLDISKQGFRTIIRPDIILHVQDILALNFNLPVGAPSEIVTVEGGAPLVNTQDATVGTVVDRQFVANIPLNGRSFQSLINLTPGVVVVPGGSLSSGQFSVNGQRASANAFTVDGVSANFGVQPGTFGSPSTSGSTPGLTALGTTQSLASVDALQEFKVQTSSYAAEYGRQPGGQISIVTRSGTNQFHGNLFDYFRNDALDANDWFADRAKQPKPPERQNDFGGTIGGPVVIPGLYDGHDRTFFFFSYEGLRLRLPQFNLSNVPTLCLRGQGSCLSGQSAAPVGIQPILNAFPRPNGRDLGNGLAEFTTSYSDPSSVDATSVRIDHTVNSKLTLFARYNKVPSESVTRLASTSNLSNLQSSRLETQTITLGATASVTPRISNELRVNYSGNGGYNPTTLDAFGGATPPPLSAIFPNQFASGALGASIVLQFTGITSTLAPRLLLLSNPVTSERQFNVVDNLSYSKGDHQFKFGIDYRRLVSNLAANTYRVSATFSSQQQVLAATAGSGSVSATIPFRPAFLNFSAYAQDTWKLSPRLTLDLGLRWDLNPAPLEANGHDAAALNEINNLATMQLAPLGTKLWKTTYNNFAPRLGLAYRLSQLPGQETVLRGGFGLFYDTGNDLAAAGFNGRFPYSSVRVISNVTFPPSPIQLAPALVPVPLTAPYGFLTVFDPDLKLPYTLQWNVALEQSLGKSQALTISYVADAGRSLLQETQFSLTSINPSFTTVQLTKGTATSDYDSLQAQLQRHLSRGLQALVSYTWAHALDEDSSSIGGRVAKRGNADFDVRHVFATAVTYDIPAPGANPVVRALLGRWSVDTTFHAQSALPVDLIARTFINPADGSTISVRPNVNPGVPFYIDDPAAPGGRKINSAAFNTAIPAGQSGNFGRNQVRGLGAWQQDFALRREFPLAEKVKLQFRGEGFNIFNHPNFGAIQTTLTAANFGQSTNMLNRQLGGVNQLYQIGGPRSFQFALKLTF